MNTILVAYDDPRSGTLPHAADLAEAVGSKLIVTNVAVPVDSSGGKEADQLARDRLAEARSSLEQRGLVAEFVPSSGSPAEAILRLAQERNVDLIVVGTRKKGFFERLVEGSVNHDILRRADCDVLVVH